MSFIRLWVTGYLHPGRAFEALREKPAPLWGLVAVLLRGAILALLWFLPRARMGLQPSMPSGLAAIPTETYYWSSLWLFPVFELAKWLLLGAVAHLILRLAGKPNDYDAILNVTGVAAIIIEPVLLAWDWIAFAAGWGESAVFMGLSHAVIAWPWGLALAAIGFKKVLGLPARITVPLMLLIDLLFLPLAATFLRS